MELTWAFAWQVLDSNQGKLTSTVLQTTPNDTLAWLSRHGRGTLGAYLGQSAAAPVKSLLAEGIQWHRARLPVVRPVAIGEGPRAMVNRGDLRPRCPVWSPASGVSVLSVASGCQRPGPSVLAWYHPHVPRVRGRASTGHSQLLLPAGFDDLGPGSPPEVAAGPRSSMGLSSCLGPAPARAAAAISPDRTRCPPGRRTWSATR